MRRAGIKWLKMLFWIPWEVMEDAAELQAVVRKVESDTGLSLGGFATLNSISDMLDADGPRPLKLLLPLLQGKPAIWLHMPDDFREQPLPYQHEPENADVQWNVLDLPLGG